MILREEFEAKLNDHNLTYSEFVEMHDMLHRLSWEDRNDMLKEAVERDEDVNNTRSTFVASPTEVVKIGEPLSNSDEISRALEKGDIYKRGYKEGYKQAIIDGKTNFSRPQGKWEHDKFDEHYCNKCGNFALWSEEADGYYEVQSNFCPNCGADMRKGERKNENN